MNVVVTGFGPFGEHKINASWEAVKLLPKYRIPEVNIFVEEIPVEYNTVEQKVPDLWKKYNPKVCFFKMNSQVITCVFINSS